MKINQYQIYRLNLNQKKIKNQENFLFDIENLEQEEKYLECDLYDYYDYIDKNYINEYYIK